MQTQTAPTNNTTQTLPDRATILDQTTLLWHGVPVREMLAYPLPLVALLLGVHRQTIYREIARGRLTRTPLGLVSRDELARYLKSQTEKCRKR